MSPCSKLAQVVGTYGRAPHNELAALIVNVLLQRSLKRMSGVRDISLFRLRTNLIFYDGIANVVNQTAQLIRIHDVVEEALSLPLACQRFELVDDFIQFPGEPRLSDSGLGLGWFGLTVPASFSYLVP